MTKEEDSTEVQSSVQYKRFDNSDAEDDSKPSDVRPTPETSPSPPPVRGNDIQVKRSSNRNDAIEGATSSHAKDKAPSANDTGEATAGGKQDNKEIVLQMNGNLGNSEPPQEPAWNWLNLVLSVASIFCCSICGVLATVTSVLAYVDHRVGDFGAAHRKRVASYGLALTALVVGVLCMVIVVLVAVHFDNKNN